MKQRELHFRRSPASRRCKAVIETLSCKPHMLVHSTVLDLRRV